MTFTTTITPQLFIVGTIAALTFGAVYVYLLNNRLKWLADRATDLSVVIGVAGSLLCLLIVFHVIGFFVVLWIFGCTGIFQLLRSAYNREQSRLAALSKIKAALQGQPDHVNPTSPTAQPRRRTD